jgi:hypothetical protein
VLETVAARLTGGSTPTIAEDPGFSAEKLSQFRDAPTYYGWFNGAKFFSLMLNATEDKEGEEPSLMPKLSPKKVLSATGLGELKSASFAIRSLPEGSLVTFHITAPENSRAGLLKIMTPASKDAGIPAFVSADTVKFTRMRLDGKQAWAEIQKMVANLSPQYLASLNSVIDMANMMAQAKNPAFDLRTFLLGNLGDDLIVCQKPPTDASLPEIANPPTLFLFTVGNIDQAIDGIKTIAGLGSPQDSANAPRDFRGHKIHTITLRPGRAAAGTPPQAASLYLSSSGGYLAISKEVGVLEEYLRSAEAKARPLRELPGLTEAAARVGGSTGLFTYENQRETMRLVFKLLKSSSPGATALPMFPPALREWADFSLLPEFDPVAKYFHFSVASANGNAEGMTLKIFAPRPPQLK